MKIDKSVIIDTNILVYLSDEESIFHNSVLNKFRELCENNYQIFITSQIKRELQVTLTKINNKLIEPKPLSTIINEINSVLNFIPILYESQNSLDILDNLILSYNIINQRIHDANIVSVAIDNQIEYIFTNNNKDFKVYKEIKIIGL